MLILVMYKVECRMCLYDCQYVSKTSSLSDCSAISSHHFQHQTCHPVLQSSLNSWKVTKFGKSESSPPLGATDHSDHYIIDKTIQTQQQRLKVLVSYFHPKEAKLMIAELLTLEKFWLLARLGGEMQWSLTQNWEMHKPSLKNPSCILWQIIFVVKI